MNGHLASSISIKAEFRTLQWSFVVEGFYLPQWSYS